MSDAFDVLKDTGDLNLQNVAALPVNLDTDGTARYVPQAVSNGNVEFKLEGVERDLKNIEADQARLGVKPQMDIASSAHKFSKTALQSGSLKDKLPQKPSLIGAPPVLQNIKNKVIAHQPHLSPAARRLGYAKLKREDALKNASSKTESVAKHGVPSPLLHAAKAVASGNPLDLASVALDAAASPQLQAKARQNMASPSFEKAHKRWAHAMEGYIDGPRMKQS